jgi:hypothetical protein
MKNTLFSSTLLGIVLATTLASSTWAQDANYPKKAVGDAPCPALGWSENLGNYLKASAQIPTAEPATDCDFHEWSWEAFVWATALDTNNVPRFMSFPTPAELLNPTVPKSKKKVPLLRLASRLHENAGSLEGTGAIVEADGNMLVAPNGYPVYASVHMNPAYFDTAKNNMIVNGGYQKNTGDYFPTGSAVFKATWLRLDGTQPAPAGAFMTEADVPLLTIENNIVVPQKDKSGAIKTVTVKVALVGLHVVGITVGHPEFLWATFEHKDNSPQTPDNTFSTSGSDPKNYTFYKGGTSFTQVNTANTQPTPATKQTPVLSFNVSQQKFSPATNAVLENKTGGESFSPLGPQNISNLNTASQTFLAKQSKGQALFANYNLIGTVWFSSNTYVDSNPNYPNLDQVNGVGSVNLANVTAETFEQVASNSDIKKVQNCFLCHNAQSYTFSTPALSARRIAISHVLAENSPTYEVPNEMPLCWNVSAGPIWNNGDAQTKCPLACGTTSKWNGQWVTTVFGKESVCGCCNN